MPIIDTATFVVGAGNFFTAAVGTALPADLLNPGVAWTNAGHTSLDDIFSLSSEGGDASNLATLQNKTLRTKYSPRVESFNFTLQQFDVASLKLYYGSNATIGGSGQVQVPTDPTPTTAAFLAVFVDGTSKFAFYAPKAEIYRADDVALSDIESLAGLPLSVKPLINGANTWTYAVTPLT